jgi:tRNA nucleotidyltransferase/poly(A) polymerase
MALFSERYGYIKPSDVIIRERITPEMKNAILTCYDMLFERLRDYNMLDLYYDMNKNIWIEYLNLRLFDWESNRMVITNYIINDNNEWFKKLDIIEYCIKYLYSSYERSKKQRISISADIFVGELNHCFTKLNFAYRIVNKEIVEITAEEEIKSIETAITTSDSNIREHLSKALELYSKRPVADYRNSIKESISAVEAISRNITGENVLNFKKMEEKGVVVPTVLRKAFECLYGYTNDKTTGIRHALMDDTNAPQAEEALFMLVSCSAFINYLNMKIK